MSANPRLLEVIPDLKEEELEYLQRIHNDWTDWTDDQKATEL